MLPSEYAPVYERFFTRSRVANREALAADQRRDVPLETMVRRLVDGMVRGYKFHAPLLAALLRYVDAHPDADFRRHAEALRAEVFAGIGGLLLARREAIQHDDPEAAITFMLVAIGLVLKGVLLQGNRLGKPISWPQLSAELGTMAVRYLGIDRQT